MASSAERHVSPDEIRLLLGSSTGSRQVDSDPLAETRLHLSECEECRVLVADLETVAGRLMNGMGNSQKARGRDCPSEEQWPLLAAELLPSKDATACAEHAASCDYCGRLLREASENFGEDNTAEEDAMIASLVASRPRGRRQLAAKLRDLSTRRREDPKRSQWFMAGTWPRIAIPIAALALIALFVFRLFTPHSSPEATAEHLIAEAYTQERTIDLRFAGADYAPMRAERGGETSRVNRPGALLDAEALVARNLAAHPSDPRWLAAKGRIDLLEWNSDSAIKSFKQALELAPDSVQYKSDLASAYFQRGESANQPVDFGSAAEWYGRVLTQEPKNAVALFNRAITYQHLFLYDQAMQDWHRYLQLDPQGPWAAEARTRMDALEKKMQGRKASSLAVPTDAVAALLLLKRLSSKDKANLPDELSPSAEDFLPAALTQWLPTLSKTSAAAETPQAGALRELAKALRTRNGDEWLQNVLATQPSVSARKGARALAEAIEANSNGDTDQAQQFANQAVAAFDAAGNRAGELRARFELVYALKRAQRGHDCLEAASHLLSALGTRRYRWLRTQSLLEQSNCEYMVGQLQAAMRETGAAMREAKQASYGTLYLRALGMAASWETAKGDTAAAWRLDCNGLARYWAGHYDGLRAWQFYDDMGYGPRADSEWNLAVALGREAVEAVALAHRPAEEAQARFHLATMAVSAGQIDEALVEFHHANQIYHSLPQSGSVKAFEANGEISLAQLEYDSGQYDSAQQRLKAVRPELTLLQSYTFPLRYYVTLGKLSLHRGDVDGAEADLHAAARITELGMRSLHDPLSRLAWEHDSGEVYRLLVRLLLKSRHNQVSALRVWEWYRSSALRRLAIRERTRHLSNSQPEEIPFAVLDSDPDLPSMREFDQALPRIQHRTVISYAWLSDGLAIWVFNSAGIHSEWIGVSQTTMERVARRFTERCANPATSLDEIDQDGSQLYKWLLQPIAAYLSNDSLLVIEPDGPIALIPFPAIRPDKHNYLGANHSILISPGIDLSAGRSEVLSALPKEDALIVGVPNVQGDIAFGLPTLPDAGTEVEMVAQHFRTKTVLLGSAASRSVVSQQMTHATVFHFAGHALSGSKRRGLLLSASDPSDKSGNGVLLSAETLEGIPMPRCRLAVLSACSLAGGEDMMANPQDLAGAFLRSGVANVVASRWNVDSAVTRLLMQTFYSGLERGDTVPTALQRAGSEIRSDPRTQHPYYWAAFSSFGQT